jgi:hypothetical protein
VLSFGNNFVYLVGVLMCDDIFLFFLAIHTFVDSHPVFHKIVITTFVPSIEFSALLCDSLGIFHVIDM